MKILYDFGYERPNSLEEALALLAEHGAGARPLAGGTDVIDNVKHRSMLQLVRGAGTSGARYPAARRVVPMDRPAVVLSLSRIPAFAGVLVGADEVVVRPMTTMTRMADTKDLPPAAEALREAAAVMGTPLIRNRGTVAGNLINARPAADTAVALTGVGARIDLASAKGRRTVPSEGFITAPGKTVKRADELVTAIRIPVGPHTGSAYLRHGTRRQLEIALVGAASWVRVDPSTGKVAEARVCLGAVGPTPLLAPSCAGALVGQEPNAEAIARAAKAARGDAKPIDDFRGSAAYRLELVEVLARRTLEAAVRRARGEEVVL